MINVGDIVRLRVDLEKTLTEFKGDLKVIGYSNVNIIRVEVEGKQNRINIGNVYLYKTLRQLKLEKLNKK